MYNSFQTPWQNRLQQTLDYFSVSLSQPLASKISVTSMQDFPMKIYLEANCWSLVLLKGSEGCKMVTKFS